MSRRLQIIFSLAIIGLIVMFFAMNSYSQKRQRDVPIVSDEPVERTDTLRIVNKDEQQRIVDRLMDRIQKLENRVAASESEIERLKDEIFNLREEIEGGL